MAETVFTGTVSIDETIGTDQNVKVATLYNRTKLGAVWFDGSNLTQSGTLKFYVDLGSAGTTLTYIPDYDLAVAVGESVNLLKDGPIEIDTDFVVRFASAGAGAGSVDIYYRIPYDELEINQVKKHFVDTAAGVDTSIGDFANPLATLSQAFTNASDGDEVVVLVYSPASAAEEGDLTCSKNITLTWKADPWIEPAGLTSGFLEFTGNVVIKGLLVEVADAAKYAVEINQSSKMIDCEVDRLTIVDADGDHLFKAENCHFSDVVDLGGQISEQFVFKGCTINDFTNLHTGGELRLVDHCTVNSAFSAATGGKYVIDTCTFDAKPTFAGTGVKFTILNSTFKAGFDGAADTSDAYCENCFFTGAVSSTVAGKVVFKVCIFEDGLTLNGPGSVVDDCILQAGLSLAAANQIIKDTVVFTTIGISGASADDCLLTNVHAKGALTIGAGVDNTRLLNVTYASISNGGTGTKLDDFCRTVDFSSLNNISKFSGTIWYVDTAIATSGVGKRPDTAFKTISEGLAAVSAGDKLIIKPGTYDENALNLNTNSVEVVCEQGVIVNNTTVSTVFTVSANYCRVEGFLLSQATQVGLAVTGTYNTFDNILVYGCSSSFFIDSVGGAIRNRFINCRSIAHTSNGFLIDDGENFFEYCLARGTGGATRGFYLRASTCDRNNFFECRSQANATAGWEVVASADENIFTDCGSGAGDGAKVDAGTNNSWIRFSIGSQITAGNSLDKDLKDLETEINANETKIDTLTTNLTTLINRVGTFTGSGVNTVLGFFKALMSSAAATPSDVGGTFSAATDSTEAIRDRGDAAWTSAAALTSQQVRDAMKLAPTGGAPAAGSVDLHLDTIETSTTAHTTTLATITALINTIIARIGTFTGGGQNTILGFFRALFRSDYDASLPTDIGGTFLPSTDSVQAIADQSKFTATDRTTLGNIWTRVQNIPASSGDVLTKDIFIDLAYEKLIITIDTDNRITQYKAGSGGNQKTIDVTRNAAGVVTSEVVS